MVERGLTADAFRARVLQPKIDDLGAAAFAHTGIVVLYSGPNDLIKRAAKAHRSNPPRSADEAKELDATRIDDTAIGTFLNDLDLYTYFGEVYKNEEDVREAVRDVWAHASREFMRAGFKAVVTVVCGADPEGVFRAHELKVILTEQTAIETINHAPIFYFTEIFNQHKTPEDGFTAAYVEICRAELDAVRLRALTAPADMIAEAWEDYNSRKLFFDLDQAANGLIGSTLRAMSGHQCAIKEPDAPGPSSPPEVLPARSLAGHHRH